MPLKSMKNNLFIMFVFIFLVFFISGCAIVDKTNKASVSNQVNNKQNIVGNDRDEHGCIGSAGYSWCDEKQKCLRIWEEPCDSNKIVDATTTVNKSSSTVEILKKLFADKYNKKISDINITISKEKANHIRGGVKLSKDEQAEGGNFLAAKVNNDWQIVFEGNGGINCNLKEKYGFPEDMMTDCYSDNNSTDNNIKETLGKTGIANPASVYCEEHNGKLEIINNENGHAGVCKFSDGSQCDEWAYFRGDCKPEEKK
jgi:putative hemolysin